MMDIARLCAFLRNYQPSSIFEPVCNVPSSLYVMASSAMAISVHKFFSPKAKLHACNGLFLMLFGVFKAEACLQCASELLQGVMGC